MDESTLLHIVIVAIIIIISIRFYFFLYTLDLEVDYEWHKHYENFTFSTQEFYSILYETLVEKNMPEVSVDYIVLFEEGLFSRKRMYIQIQRRKTIFLVCALPLGSDFYVGYRRGWIKEDEEEGSDEKPTFYQSDTERAFRESAHKAVMHAVQVMIQHYGYRQGQSLNV
jgi:hypothetical protein